MSEKTKRLLGFGQRQLEWLKGDICKAEKYNFDVLLIPCKFDNIYCHVDDNNRSNFNEDDVVKALGNIFSQKQNQSKSSILDKMSDSNLYFHIHTEQEYAKGNNNDKYTEINKPNKDKFTMILLHGIIQFFGEVNKGLNKKVNFIEVHSSLGKSTDNVKLLIKNLKSLSEKCKQYHNLRLGLEYGRVGTCFTGKNIETVMDRVGDDVDFVYDLSLAFQDANNEDIDPINKLKKYIENYSITQVHWNNFTMRKIYNRTNTQLHRPLLHKKDNFYIKKKDILKVIEILCKYTKNKEFIHILEHTIKPFCEKYNDTICKEIQFIRHHDNFLKHPICKHDESIICGGQIDY